jgi:hypothetical protein
LKFNIGDRVRCTHNNREGVVKDIAKHTLMVEVNSSYLMVGREEMFELLEDSFKQKENR